MLYMVSYTLSPVRLAPDIITELQTRVNGEGGWWHYMDTLWMIATLEDIGQISARLRPHFKESDLWIVMELKAGATYEGWLSQDAWDWLVSTGNQGWIRS